MAVTDYHANLLVEVSQSFKHFDFDGDSTFFTKVDVWDADIQQRPSLSSDVPFCGVTFLDDAVLGYDVQQSVSQYRLQVSIIFAWPSGTAKNASIYKARMVTALKKFVRTNLAYDIHQAVGRVDVEDVYIKAEDIVFGSDYRVIGKKYGGIVMTILVKDALEDLT